MVNFGDAVSRNDFSITGNLFLSDDNVIRKTFLRDLEATRVIQGLMMKYVGENPDLKYYEYVGAVAELKMNVNMSIDGRNRKDVIDVYKSFMKTKAQAVKSDKDD
jgi:hypothetical protein